MTKEIKIGHVDENGYLCVAGENQKCSDFHGNMCEYFNKCDGKKCIDDERGDKSNVCFIKIRSKNMTREKAREAAKVMLAYADGKDVNTKYNDAWVVDKNPEFNFGIRSYRIKPEPKYRPFETIEEVEPFFGKKIRFKSNKSSCILTGAEYQETCMHLECGSGKAAAWYVFDNATFEDETPVGIKVSD